MPIVVMRLVRRLLDVRCAGLEDEMATTAREKRRETRGACEEMLQQETWRVKNSIGVQYEASRNRRARGGSTITTHPCRRQSDGTRPTDNRSSSPSQARPVHPLASWRRPTLLQSSSSSACRLPQSAAYSTRSPLRRQTPSPSPSPSRPCRAPSPPQPSWSPSRKRSCTIHRCA